MIISNMMLLNVILGFITTGSASFSYLDTNVSSRNEINKWYNYIRV